MLALIKQPLNLSILSKNILHYLRYIKYQNLTNVFRLKSTRTQLTLNTLTWQPELCIGRTSVDELGGNESTCNLNGTPLSPP